MAPTNDQLLNAASAGDLNSISTLLANYTPSQDMIQEMINRAIRPTIHLNIINFLLFTHSPSSPISEENIRWTCYSGSIPLAELLYTKDPSVFTNSFDESGTPLACAIQSCKSYAFLSWLVSHGADIRSPHGRCAPPFPASVLLYHGKLDALRALNDNGVDLRGENVLLAAVGRGYVDVVRFLLENGVTPQNDRGEDEEENRGTVPVLHVAARKGDVEIVRLLVEFGADREVRDENGRTAFEIAEERKDLKIMELLCC